MSDRLFFNITPTALDATALELARLACAADTAVCAKLTVQNNGPVVGIEQWNYISTNNPPWTPYPYAETPILTILNGMTITEINTQIGVYQTTTKNVFLPSCPIGSTPIWDIATGEQTCISQTDRALEYNVWVYIVWYVFIFIIFLWAIMALWYLSYIPAYFKNITFGPPPKKQL